MTMANKHKLFVAIAILAIIGAAVSVIMWERSTPMPYIGETGGTVFGIHAQTFYLGTGIVSVLLAIISVVGAVKTRLSAAKE